MLLKLVCDDSCGFVRRLGAAEMRVGWVVEEDIALCDATQIAALNAAINEARRETCASTPTAAAMEVPGLGDYALLMAASGQPLDVRRTPNELGLQTGAALQLVYTAKQLHNEGGVSLSNVRSWPRQQQRREQQSSPPAVNTEDDTEEENDEVYASRELGWFPFLLRPHEGEPLVLISNPHTPVRERDAHPNARPLCETCAALVSHGEALRVAVDVHYKPMLMRQDYLEMFVEKLGGGHLRRWQSRFIQMSEKSIDWFAEKPKPGVKSRIHGHRYIVRDGECQVEALINCPDPEKYSHCKDTHFNCFAVAFRNPSKTYFFRVKTEEQRELAVEFLEKCIKRVRDRAPVHNPVTWKQRVDRFLCNAAQLGELYSTQRMAIEALQMQVRFLEEELAEALEQKPKLLAAVETQTGYVQALCGELAGYEANLKQARQWVRAAEARVAEEERLLQEEQIVMGEDIHKVAIIKRYAQQQREATEKNMAELRVRAAALQEEENTVFRKWRKLEERHRVELETLPHSGLYSFSEDGVGVPSGTSRLSMELVASVARLALNSEPPCSLTTSSLSPRRRLMYSTSREREL
ncbi:hypothetical protein TraAM80_02262 [Trypanosoma rangeli]|uniref:PH domain-containing protein n=1 Tax=Trypanosoma rangeli TaxID=5698 RepID=A0A422NV16_TRYRA|nr:uncharacterized protein TraAM80_02262 [Trypanosoma rangeli]RNF09315.1 hypothetical protein TraAM80_02262 [Trypanosoma rangeli]|eukprot:RNF09315.1 hypothetical protein TraAM80_02262 [Trypanosoma rangeli]